MHIMDGTMLATCTITDWLTLHYHIPSMIAMDWLHCTRISARLVVFERCTTTLGTTKWHAGLPGAKARLMGGAVREHFDTITITSSCS